MQPVLPADTLTAAAGKATDGAQLGRFAFLDGMRGIAALFVMTRHTRAFWPFEFYRSYIAVDLFFILSGFVIAHAYDDKLGTRRISITEFAASRMIRLYPVYFLSVVIATIVLCSQAAFFGAHLPASVWDVSLMILATFAFLPSHFIAADFHMFPLNYPYWSLFFELVANAIYAIMHRYLSAAVLGVLILISCAYTVRSALRHGNLDTGFIFNRGGFATGALRTTLGFFLGVVLYRYRSVLSKHLIRHLSPWLGIAIIVAVLGSDSWGSLDPYLDLFAVGVLFPIAVLIVANTRRSTWEKTLLLLGSASYPIYVLHQPLGRLIHDAVGPSIEALAPWSGYVLAALLILISVQLEKHYDIPLRKRLTAKLRRRAEQAAGTLGRRPRLATSTKA